MPTDNVLVVTGLKWEARIVGRWARRVLIGGSGIGLADRLDRAIGERPCALLSIGIAGGLRPGLAPGTVVIASSVSGNGYRLSTDAAWTDNLARAISDARVGAIAGESRIVWSAAEKARLHHATQALAVDMESHIASNVAHARRIPFSALRVIADPAERSLAEAAQTAVAPDGAVRIAHVLKSLFAAPAQSGAVIRAAMDAEAARCALTRCCRLAGPGFCLPDVRELPLDVS